VLSFFICLFLGDRETEWSGIAVWD
jgi:hypothetical protein